MTVCGIQLCNGQFIHTERHSDCHVAVCVLVCSVSVDRLPDENYLLNREKTVLLVNFFIRLILTQSFILIGSCFRRARSPPALSIYTFCSLTVTQQLPLSGCRCICLGRLRDDFVRRLSLKTSLCSVTSLMLSSSPPADSMLPASCWASSFCTTIRLCTGKSSVEYSVLIKPSKHHFSLS